ncbi:anhydro-N-acetylmuramic acid kinase [Flavicella sediminum]|uniref:anhydro-N-acetylmuramic acid kinase n=1 Tax=Flavicella sediminum TaxID=2585141 RepID=UPI0011222B5E|nr:anhydro-N-acetylmuramic acid kinase [Flavicella sediminum]
MGKTYFVIGLMSGTSLDGVDLVFAEISVAKEYTYTIKKTETFAYPKEWSEKLKYAFEQSETELKALDKEYGKYLGNLVLSFVTENKIAKVDFIASHGHTIFHKPNEGYTLQIGCGEEISKINNTKVVYDFRSQDVALGGQGAPLVPVGDKLLFSEFEFCLNIGGFANVSFEENGLRKAFDICPVNIVMNYFTRTIGLEYDDKGKLASEGNVHEELLQQLNADPFYELPIPKSLGFEFVQEKVLPLIHLYPISLKDVLRTFVEHVAIKISEVLSTKKKAKTLVTGGGAYNTFLIGRIQELTETEIVIPSKELVEFKEALLFALLGVLKIEGKTNCLKSVTGASHDHSSGVVVAIS